MAKENAQEVGTQPSWLKRCGPAVGAALLVGLLLGLCWGPGRPDPGNTCGWPDVVCQQIQGEPTARMVLDQILVGADEALEKRYIDQGTRDEVAHLVEVGKRETVRYPSGQHVCSDGARSACKDLGEIIDFIQAAANFANNNDLDGARREFNKALEGLRDFPSGQ